jgi:hypothetical protein
MRFFNDWYLRRRIRSTGQALILIVMTFMGLLLFLGLMIDLGQIFLAKGYLRRAADAASLAAAAQFRENRTINEMELAAEEVSEMNGISPTSITVETCESTGGTDPSLCPKLLGKMPKKLVRVTIVMDYPLTFLSLLNIYTVKLTEVSISEAASMDVVLVIDTSESMAWDGTPGNGTGGPSNQDPSVCNVSNDCKPFRQVKDAALSFATSILNKVPGEEEDRLSIVTFATGWQAPPLGTQLMLGGNGWTDDIGVAATAINSLMVYDPGTSWKYSDPDPNPLPIGVTRVYDDVGNYQGMNCLRTFIDDPLHTYDKAGAISACSTTNIGGGLTVAGNQFATDKRPEALWVVVLLTDGMANATFPTNDDVGGGSPPDEIIIPTSFPLNEDTLLDAFPLGLCPDGDWIGSDMEAGRSYCQDQDAETHHLAGSSMYDADDFARDQARFVGCPAALASPATGCSPTKGQGAIIFSIGLGSSILYLDKDGSAPYAGSLLRFIAAVGDDGNPDTDQCALQPDYTKSCGNYFYASVGTELEKVFEAIYSRIFTRLTA